MRRRGDVAAATAMGGRVGMLEENPTNFLNRLRVPLHRVIGSHDLLRFDAVDVRARVLDHTIVAGIDRTLALDRNDRVGGDVGSDWNRRKRFDESMVR
jgi:hypothetical protein